MRMLRSCAPTGDHQSPGMFAVSSVITKFKVRSRYTITTAFIVAAAALGQAVSAHTHPTGQTLVFAVNEGVTYQTGCEASRQNYKAIAIADDLGRLMKAKVRLDVIGEYATLEKDLAAKTYDVAFIHPVHIAIVLVKRGAYTLTAVSKARTGYKA